MTQSLPARFQRIAESAKGLLDPKSQTFWPQEVGEPHKENYNENEEVMRGVPQIVAQVDATVDFIMKGAVQTADLMRAALNRETGIRAGKLMSHLALLWTPTFGRILGLSDGGIVLSPDVEKKANIIRNSVDAMHKLGWERPNVAVICGLEFVNPAMPCTVDADELAKMSRAGEIEGCVVDGPFGFDNAISELAAERKGVTSPIAGKADLVIVPEIEVGNVLYKGLVFMAEGVRTAGVLLGAQVPIVMVSRSDGSDAKLNAIAVGAVISHAAKA